MKISAKISFILMVLFLVSACKKEEEKPSTNTTTDSYAINAANPQDWVGRRHNGCLDTLLKEHYNKTFTSRDEIFQLSFDYLAVDYPSPSYNDLYVRYKSAFDGSETTTDFGLLLSSNGASASVVQYTQRMLDSFDLAPNNTAFCGTMKTLEQEIMNSTVLDSTEQAILLSSAAVFRYSSNYWNNNFVIWEDFSGGSGGHTAGSIAKEDGKGAVIGGVGGSLGGPGGAVVGGLLGAAGNSLASWIFD